MISHDIKWDFSYSCAVTYKISTDIAHRATAELLVNFHVDRAQNFTYALLPNRRLIY